MERADSILDALTRAALEATAARDGWLLAGDDGGSLRVAAAAGDEAAAAVGDRVDPGQGIEGLVLASGQPLAVTRGAGDSRLREGVLAALEREPESVLCVACEQGEGPLGVLLLADKEDGSAFTLEDVEITTLLGDVAAVALEQRSNRSLVPSPAELARELAALAASDSVRYARIAPFVAAFLRHG